MRSNILMLSIIIIIGCFPVHAQTHDIPPLAKIPDMNFDKNIPDKAIEYDEDKLPLIFKIDKLSISLGRTTLTEVSNALKTGIPLHDGKGYYQCYSIPKYSHQIWFVTVGQNFSEPITELVIARGKPLPTEFCPMITAFSHPIFSDNIRLNLPEELINVVLGKPLNKKQEQSLYFYLLPQKTGKLKIQTHIDATGLDKIKITKESFYQ